jgi:PhzF family phenazine biosynthesis protein
LSDPTPTELEPVIGALRVPADGLLAGSRIATLGRARLLVPVSSAAVVAALRPDSERLRAVCDQFGWLGCYVYSPPTSGGRVAARMFAPSIGVPEDVANANSTACLAVHLAGSGPVDITVDMGDSLHRPATITASLRPTPTGQRVLVGGAAVIGRTDD